MNYLEYKEHIKKELRRVKVGADTIGYILDALDDSYKLGYSHGMCDTCKKTGQVRQSAGPYDLGAHGRARRER